MKFKYILPVCAIAFSSCETLFEEKTTNQWDDKYAWEVARIAEGVLMNAYNAIEKRPDSYDNNFLDAATDNAVTNQYGSSIYKLGMGQFSATNNPIGIWGKCYEQFQYINSFLENGLTDKTVYNRKDEAIDARYKERLKGEAHFLRAYWGFRLLQVYGGKTETGEALGYPIQISFVSEEDAANLQITNRDSYEACVNQIIDDCNVAIELLPEVYSGDDPVTAAANIGRATKLVAMALKSRVALYAASPAYQSNDIVEIKEMGKFEVKNVEAYQEKWQAALQAADECVNSLAFGDFNAMTAKDLADAANTTPSEFIFRAFYNNKDIETRHFAPYYYGKAYNTPSQNLVNAFPSINGYPIDDQDNDDYNPNAPYENRDKRFYLNVYYHGAIYGNKGLPVDISEGGKDAQTFNQYASRTGYYLSKFLSKNESMLNPIEPVNSLHYYPMMRKTEVLLNYAEASNEVYGPKNKGSYTKKDGTTATCKYSAYDIIKMIREKSGGITDTRYLDEMANDKNDFRTLIQNERRIELAFENHRFFDVRRWLLPLDVTIKGVSVTENSDGLKYEYYDVERRKLDDIKYYYMPLPYDECVKNPDLVNNLGWK